MTHDEAIETGAAERYQLGEMSEVERHAFEAHFFECQACAEDVRLGASLEASVRAHGDVLPGSPAQSIPAQVPPMLPRRSRRQPGMFVALAAAAALALVAGYQGLVTIPSLREAARHRALSPVTLTPLSRGELPVVPAADGPVTLSLDVNVRPQTAELIYDLGTEDGTSLLSGSAQVPQPGVPLLLLLPGNTLTTGRYVLTLREAADRSNELGTYRFEVQ